MLAMGWFAFAVALLFGRPAHAAINQNCHYDTVCRCECPGGDCPGTCDGSNGDCHDVAHCDTTYSDDGGGGTSNGNGNGNGGNPTGNGNGNGHGPMCNDNVFSGGNQSPPPSGGGNFGNSGSQPMMTVIVHTDSYQSSGERATYATTPPPCHGPDTQNCADCTAQANTCEQKSVNFFSACKTASSNIAQKICSQFGIQPNGSTGLKADRQTICDGPVSNGPGGSRVQQCHYQYDDPDNCISHWLNGMNSTSQSWTSATANQVRPTITSSFAPGGIGATTSGNGVTVTDSQGITETTQFVQGLMGACNAMLTDGQRTCTPIEQQCAEYCQP
jgi:hypothetical protein